MEAWAVVVVSAISAGVVLALWAAVELDRLWQRDEPIDRPWPQQWHTLREHDWAAHRAVDEDA